MIFQRTKASGQIRVGIGGWNYAPWRGRFYPPGLPQKNELEFAAAQFSTIEINGTFYGPQKPATFAKWRDDTPSAFEFAVKAPRYATHRRKLDEAGPTIERFLRGGLLELKQKLGPINWQLMPTTRFDAGEIERFFSLLPKRVGRRELRHAIEVRHESFRSEHFIDLARRHHVAVIVSGDSPYPQIADVTADFVYVRIMGTKAGIPAGYTATKLDQWAGRAVTYASAGAPKEFQLACSRKAKSVARDVYLYVIGGGKEANPGAALALTQRLQAKRPRRRPQGAGHRSAILSVRRGTP